MLDLPDFETAKTSLFNKVDVSDALARRMFNDSRYPLGGDKFKLAFWVNAANDGIDSPASKLL